MSIIVCPIKYKQRDPLVMKILRYRKILQSEEYHFFFSGGGSIGVIDAATVCSRCFGLF